MLKNRLFKLFLFMLVSVGIFYLLTDMKSSSEGETKQKEHHAKQVSSKEMESTKSDAKNTKKKLNSKIKPNSKVKSHTKEKLNSKGVIALLSDSLVSNSDGYFEVKGEDSVSVFSKKRNHVIGMRTGSWYNLWGHDTGNCTYNMSRLKKHGTKLNMKAGLEDGGSGTATVEFYMDKSTDESPDYKYELDAGMTPVSISVSIKHVKSMTIQITNHSGDQNTIALYGMSLS